MAISLQFLKQILPSLLPFALPLFLSLFFLHKWLSPNPNSASSKKPPPSPPKLPIIGNLHQVGGHAHRTLRTFSRKYGDLMLLQLGSKPTLVVSSAKAASQVLRTYDSALSGRPNFYMSRNLFYEGKEVLFGTYGEHWRHMRSICVLQLLSNKRVRSFRQVRDEEVALMVENVRESLSEEVNLSEMFLTLASDMVCRAAFGRKYTGEIDGVNFVNMIRDLADMFGSYNVEDVLPWMGWINRINGVDAKVKKLYRSFDEFLEKIVVEHANRVKECTLEDDSIGVDDHNMKDFVDILLQAQREGNSKGESFDNQSIKGVILDMFAAGTHAAQLSMEWAFTEILRHPRVVKRLQEEVRGVAGDNKWVSEEDLQKLVYLRAVIKESLRMHPPLPLLVPRECTEDVKIGEYHIAAGTQAFINAWAIGRDPAWWEDPESFVPERFLNCTIDFKGKDYQLIPFGGGRRGCPGISFAEVNMELGLANLLHQFDWALPVGGEKESLDITEAPGLSAHKMTPLVAVPIPRNK